MAGFLIFIETLLCDNLSESSLLVDSFFLFFLCLIDITFCQLWAYRHVQRDNGHWGLGAKRIFLRRGSLHTSFTQFKVFLSWATKAITYMCMRERISASGPVFTKHFELTQTPVACSNLKSVLKCIFIIIMYAEVHKKRLIEILRYFL